MNKLNLRVLAIFSLIIISSFNIKAQNLFERDSVIQVQHLNSAQIFDGVKRWFVSSCKDSRDVIQIEDKANGSIVGKFFFPFEINNLTYAAGTGYVSFVVDIKIREGRFKVKLTNFSHTSTSPSYSEWWSMGYVKEEIPNEWKSGFKWKQKRGVYKHLLPEIEDYSQTIFYSLSNYLQQYKPDEDDDW